MLLISIFIAVLLVSGCCSPAITNRSLSEKDSLSPVVVNIPLESAEPVAICELLDSISIIPLEMSANSLISHIFKIVASADYFYIRDGHNTGSVLIFRNNGQFLKAIPNGPAPNEVSGVADIFYDKTGNCLYVFDHIQDKILKFSPDGSYLSHYYISERQVRKIAAVDSTILLSKHSLRTFQIVKTDSLMNSFDLWTFADDQYYFLLQNFQPFGRGINISALLDNNIYFYSSNEISVKYTIRYQQPDIRHEQYNGVFRDMLIDMPDGDWIYIGNNVETSDYLYVDLLSSGSQRTFFYSKKSENCIEYIPVSIFRYCRGPFLFSESENILIGIIEPSIMFDPMMIDAFRWDGSNPGNLVSEADMEKLRSAKPDDNPIIVLFKLKSDL